MVYAALKAVHVLSLMLWLGGMVYGNFFLRPALAALAPPERVRLMHAVLGRFLGAVGVAVLLVLGSGLGMVGLAARMAAQSGGRFSMPLAWTVMAALGLLMMAVFGHIRFALYPRLGRAVAAQDWPAGAAALAQVRTGVHVNLALGVLIVLVVLLGAAY